MSLLSSRDDGGGPAEFGNTRSAPRFARGSGILKSIRRSFRRRKPRDPPPATTSRTPAGSQPEKSWPDAWLQDEINVKAGTCQFKVKYLGVLEVKESKGTSHCEEAVKRHKQRKERNKKRALLCISPETIRLIKEKNKQLILDQTIEKVSFCAPDSTYTKAFSYICRDGTTKRWMCHSFTAMNVSGERLSHAVGYAFKACLANKKEIEKANLNLNSQETTFFYKEKSVDAPALIGGTEISEAQISQSKSVDVEVEGVEEKSEKKIMFEIKSLPRPCAPEHMKRQASLRAFVPSPKQEAFKQTKSARVYTIAERLKGKEILNPVPEYEAEDPQKPIQAVQPFTRNQPIRSTIATATVEPNHQIFRKPVAPIREVDPWGDSPNNNIVKSQTEPTFAAFQQQRPFPVQPVSRLTTSQSFVQKTRGDAWMESITQEMTALKTGESIASTVSSTGKQAPIIPKRTGIAALPHFNRSQSQYQSMKSPQSIQNQMQFARSHSVRYPGSSGLSSTSSSPNPFQEAPFPVSNSMEVQWDKKPLQT